MVECQTNDPELWWKEDVQHITKWEIECVGLALTICNRCPLKQACLEMGLKDEFQFGIWGGYMAGERYQMKRQTKFRYQRDAVTRAKRLRQQTGVPQPTTGDNK